ncbi:MAG: RNA polymerase sigma factor [Eubacteriales bacterium]|nr:RNA polymerase sigma factor [Eubacteriales bacterium]
MTIQEIEQSINLYGKNIYSFCLQLTTNQETADELYQETWLMACKNAEKMNANENVKSYLMSVAIHLWKNQKRKFAWRKRIAPTEEFFEETGEVIESQVRDGLEVYLEQETQSVVRKAVGKLSEKYRIPILLCYMEEMSLADISKTMGIPLGTVKSRLNYARKRLEQELEEYRYE